MLSKLNPFKRKIPDMMKRHSIAPGQDLYPKKYLEHIQNGRASLSGLSRNYANESSTKSGVLATMPYYEEEQNLLENTSIADLIRAIGLYHVDNLTQEAATTMEMNTKQRKMGTDHLSHRLSLLTLLNKRHHSSHTIHGPTAEISPIMTKQRERLYSCVTENLRDNNNRGRILGDANPFKRKQSISSHPPPYSGPSQPNLPQNDSFKSTIKRRFSVRPSNLDKAPGQFHKIQNSPVTAASNLSPVSFTRKLSWRRPITSSLAKPNEH